MGTPGAMEAEWEKSQEVVQGARLPLTFKRWWLRMCPARISRSSEFRVSVQWVIFICIVRLLNGPPCNTQTQIPKDVPTFS